MVMAGAELEWDSHRWSVRRRLVVVVGKRLTSCCYCGNQNVGFEMQREGGSGNLLDGIIFHIHNFYWMFSILCLAQSRKRKYPIVFYMSLAFQCASYPHCIVKWSRDALMFTATCRFIHQRTPTLDCHLDCFVLFSHLLLMFYSFEYRYPTLALIYSYLSALVHVEAM